MAQDLNQEEVLIARNNDTGQVGAVTGLNEDGTPKMADAKSAKLSDLVKFSKGQNPLEAFMSNFVRQCKNPSTFGFFKVPADQYDTVGQVTAELAKDPEANDAMLAASKVEAPLQEQSQTEQQTPQPEHKYQAIDESRIDWANLKEKWGIDRDELAKSGDLTDMLYNRKSKLVTVTPTFGGEKFPIDARLSFRTDADGNVKVVPHFIHREPNLNKEFEGYKFSDEDKEALKATGNLGKVVELTDKSGNKVPSYVSIDRYTNELLSVPVKDVYIKNKIGETELSIAEVMRLKEGKAIGPKEFTTKNGKTFKAVVQISADNKGIEFLSANQLKQAQGQTQNQRDWLTKDGKIRPISKWAGVPLTPQQQSDYTAGKVVEMTNMVDKKGQPCTVYLQFNPEKQRPFTSFNDPRVKVANESKTQKAVNNDGLTNEATKNISDPLTKGQTQPKDDAQMKQQRKPKGPKL